MFSKAVFVFCAQALLVQSALSQCTSRAAVAAEPGLIGAAGLTAPYALSAPALAAPYDRAAPGMAAPYGIAAPCGVATPALDFTPTRGGELPVSSASAVAPVGLAVASENAYEGALAVAGELPFVGTVGLEGVLPTAGTGVVNHACGNGRNAMISGDATFAPTYAGAAKPSAAATIAPAAAMAPRGTFAPAAAIAPGLVTPALGYSAKLAGRGCGHAL